MPGPGVGRGGERRLRHWFCWMILGQIPSLRLITGPTRFGSPAPLQSADDTGSHHRRLSEIAPRSPTLVWVIAVYL